MAIWAGLQIPGISNESNAASDLAKSSSISEPLDKTLQDSFRSPFNECCVSAQRNLNFAIERGVYFAHRMPDWALGFKTKTTDILNTQKRSSLIAKHHRDKRYNDHGSDYSFVCRKDRFENSALGFFDESEVFNQETTNNVKDPEPLKPLKIKDDITCRKRKST
ncbi:uncharacterized protein Dwil_GK27263 [Drosophila willistoni]|nr:uncharacterized protein Dwil_GK27263 [Drosophila willistoni]